MRLIPPPRQLEVALAALASALVVASCREATAPPSIDASVSPLCQLGCVEEDPNPNAPGIFLGSGATPTACFDGEQNDQDYDGLGDYCEKMLSWGFAPELRYSIIYDDTRGEPYWVARPDSAAHVVIGYLFAYYRDLGTVEYGCSPPAGLPGCHDGDSESVWLTLYYNPETSHWLLHQALYSVHTGWIEVTASRPDQYALYVEYPAKLGGYPRVWIAEGKHANYFTQSDCDNGGFLETDDCDSDSKSKRFPWSAYWNIGSQNAPLIDCVASRDSSYEYYGGGRTECFWMDKRFRGWVPDSIGGGDSSSYLSKLVMWGFAVTP